MMKKVMMKVNSNGVTSYDEKSNDEIIKLKM